MHDLYGSSLKTKIRGDKQMSNLINVSWGPGMLNNKIYLVY